MSPPAKTQRRIPPRSKISPCSQSCGKRRKRIPSRRYPIGEFQYPGPYSPEERAALIARIAALPGELRTLVAAMSEAQLDTPYREGGWTPRQVIHHLCDSHMHSYLRFKYALAEDGAAILAYPEDKWAMLSDVRHTPVALSLDLLDALHARWVILLEYLCDAEFERAFVHPENGRVALDRALGNYAWHGDHHLAHVRLVAEGRLTPAARLGYQL